MRYIVLLSVILLFTSCYESELDCQRFHKGTFLWEQQTERGLLEAMVRRTDSLYISKFENQVDSSRLEWINNCEYRIIPINPQTNAESRAYLFKILRTRGDTSFFKFRQSGEEQFYDGKAIKL